MLTVSPPVGGDLDFSFARGFSTNSVNGYVSSVAVQPDGKILIAGDFTTVSGVTRNRIARLNADGSLNTDFQNGMAGTDGAVGSVTMQTNGQVLIGGWFTNVNGVGRTNIARLNAADGSLDRGFQEGMAGADDCVESVTVQSNKVLIGGWFTNVNGVTRYRIAQLNTNGSLDTDFQNNMDGTDETVFSIAVQSDGKVLIGGDFTSVNGTNRNRIGRLNSNGSLDNSFQNGMTGVSGGVGNWVESVALQANGKVLIGGYFTKVNGTNRNYIARLNANDGSLDTSFQNDMAGANNYVRSVVVQPDGKVLIGGDFSSVNGTNRNGIARLNADGSLDTGFQNGMAGANNYVRSVAVQPDGQVLIGGDFTMVNGLPAAYVARLYGTQVAPWIVTQPPNLFVPMGGTAQFSVVAGGVAPLFYQWQHNGINLIGQTNATLTITGVQPADNGLYSVVISNSFGSVTSTIAYLNNTPPHLLPITNCVAHAGVVVSLQVSAIDTDSPPNQLTFSLGPDAPPSATINPTNGLITWPTTSNDAETYHPITVIVTDDGIPPLSDTNTFTIVLLDELSIVDYACTSTNFIVTWSAVPGAVYRVQYASSLTGPWTDLPGDVVATSTTASKVDNFAPTATTVRFYRILTGPITGSPVTVPVINKLCLLLTKIYPGPGITVDRAPAASNSTVTVNDPIPLVVSASDMDQLKQDCICLESGKFGISSRLVYLADPITYRWVLQYGGGSLAAVDRPATLYTPPDLQIGETNSATVQAIITDSRDNDVPATVTCGIQITRLDECSYKRILTVQTQTTPGNPIVISPSQCDCGPNAIWYAQPDALTGQVQGPIAVGVGQRVLLQASGTDSDTLFLYCSGTCGAPSMWAMLPDELKYTWSADRGSFPDYGGTPVSNGRQTSVIYQAPDTVGDDTVTVVIGDSGKHQPGGVDSTVTKTMQVKVVKITDVNPAASDTNTYKIASVQAAACNPKLHFVTVKGTNDIVLQATVEPNTDEIKNLISWERADGGAIQSPVDGDKTKAKLSRNEDGKKIPIRIKVGDKTCREIIVWIIWGTGTITQQPALSFSRKADTNIDGTATMSAVVQPDKNYRFKFTIKPKEIITDPDRPDLSGAKAGGPPGGNSPFTGYPLAGGADKKWDVSRRAQYRILNPNLIPKGKFSKGFGTIYDGQPQADSIAVDFPADTVVGNDDSGVSDENNDPYNDSKDAELGHAKGEVTSIDWPSIWMPEAGAANGFTYEERDFFGEFLRVELNAHWYRASDFLNWKIVMKVQFQGGQWVDNGSATGPGN